MKTLSKKVVLRRDVAVILIRRGLFEVGKLAIFGNVSLPLSSFVGFSYIFIVKNRIKLQCYGEIELRGRSGGRLFGFRRGFLVVVQYIAPCFLLFLDLYT